MAKHRDDDEKDVLMRADRKSQMVDGQTDFSGGMNLLGDLAANEYRWGKNIVIRSGDAETRPGFHRAYRVLTEGFNETFYFNQDNARYNDATHTGFWFPWQWVGSVYGDIQGTSFFRFTDDAAYRQILVSDGSVYVHTKGYTSSISTAEAIGTSETIQFVQAHNKLVMLRSDGNNPLYWDGADQDAGFVSFTNPGQTGQIPTGDKGVYVFGRLLVVKGDDDIYVSDVLDIDTYDWTDQLFSIRKGDGDEITAVVQWQDDYVIVFKKRSVSALRGLNSYVDVAGGEVLSQYVSKDSISESEGMVGPNAFAVHGQEISFLSYKGITSVRRTAEGSILGRETTLSAKIQPLINRINWNYAHNACGVFYDNYLMFAVPLDSSTVNDAVLVYDYVANGGSGAWVGVWQSDLLKPVRFFVEAEKLYFLGTDGGTRKMMTNDPWDSEDIWDDIPLYSATTLYEEGQRVYKEIAGVKRAFIAVKESLNQDVTDTDYFTEYTAYATDEIFPVESEMRTRFLKHGDEASPKRWGRCQLLFEHKDPKISVSYESEDYNTETVVFTDITYDQRVYDVNNLPDWDRSNIDDDWQEPHRQDYTLFLSDRQLTVQDGYTYFTVNDALIHGITAPGLLESTLFARADGIYLNVWETHTLRFIPRMTNQTGISVLVSNTRGSLKIKSIILTAQQSHFAKRGR